MPKIQVDLANPIPKIRIEPNLVLRAILAAKDRVGMMEELSKAEGALSREVDKFLEGYEKKKPYTAKEVLDHKNAVGVLIGRFNALAGFFEDASIDNRQINTLRLKVTEKLEEGEVVLAHSFPTNYVYKDEITGKYKAGNYTAYDEGTVAQDEQRARAEADSMENAMEREIAEAEEDALDRPQGKYRKQEEEFLLQEQQREEQDNEDFVVDDDEEEEEGSYDEDDEDESSSSAADDSEPEFSGSYDSENSEDSGSDMDSSEMYSGDSDDEEESEDDEVFDKRKRKKAQEELDELEPIAPYEAFVEQDAEKEPAPPMPSIRKLIRDEEGARTANRMPAESMKRAIVQDINDANPDKPPLVVAVGGMAFTDLPEDPEDPEPESVPFNYRKDGEERVDDTPQETTLFTYATRLYDSDDLREYELDDVEEPYQMHEDDYYDRKILQKQVNEINAVRMAQGFSAETPLLEINKDGEIVPITHKKTRAAAIMDAFENPAYLLNQDDLDKLHEDELERVWYELGGISKDVNNFSKKEWFNSKVYEKILDPDYIYYIGPERFAIMLKSLEHHHKNGFIGMLPPDIRREVLKEAAQRRVQIPYVHYPHKLADPAVDPATRKEVDKFISQFLKDARRPEYHDTPPPDLPPEGSEWLKLTDRNTTNEIDRQTMDEDPEITPEAPDYFTTLPVSRIPRENEEGLDDDEPLAERQKRRNAGPRYPPEAVEGLDDEEPLALRKQRRDAIRFAPDESSDEDYGAPDGAPDPLDDPDGEEAGVPVAGRRAELPLMGRALPRAVRRRNYQLPAEVPNAANAKKPGKRIKLPAHLRSKMLLEGKRHGPGSSEKFEGTVLAKMRGMGQAPIMANKIFTS